MIDWLKEIVTSYNPKTHKASIVLKDATASDVHQNSEMGGDKGKKKKKPKGNEIVTTKDEWSLTIPITKVDDEQRMVWGWASVIEEGGAIVTDKQDDQIEVAELSKAAREFMRHSRVGGEMHNALGVGTVVESLVFTPEVQTALGVDLGKVGWFVGYHVTNDDVWARVKKGELAAFSFGGRARREEI